VSGTLAGTGNVGPLEPGELRAELLRIRALLEI
jgi:hypothetical protein